MTTRRRIRALRQPRRSSGTVVVMGSGLGADAPPRNDDGVYPDCVLTGQGASKFFLRNPVRPAGKTPAAAVVRTPKILVFTDS
jgi:hypothetical protein